VLFEVHRGAAKRASPQLQNGKSSEVVCCNQNVGFLQTWEIFTPEKID